MVAFFTFARSSFGQYHLAKHSASLPLWRSRKEHNRLQSILRDYDDESTYLIGQDLVNQVESSSPVDNIVVLKKIWSNGLVAFGKNLHLFDDKFLPTYWSHATITQERSLSHFWYFPVWYPSWKVQLALINLGSRLSSLYDAHHIDSLSSASNYLTSKPL